MAWMENVATIAARCVPYLSGLSQVTFNFGGIFDTFKVSPVPANAPPFLSAGFLYIYQLALTRCSLFSMDYVLTRTHGLCGVE